MWSAEPGQWGWINQKIKEMERRDLKGSAPTPGPQSQRLQDGIWAGD